MNDFDFPDFDYPARQAERLRDNLRASQREYVNARRDDLGDKLRRELSVDAAQLLGIAQIGAGWLPPIDNRMTTGTPVHPAPKDSVLDEIFRIVRHRLPEDVIRAAEQDSRDPDWVNSEHYGGIRQDRPNYGDGQDPNHPEYRLWYLKQLALDDTSTIDDANNETREKLRYAYEFHAHLFQLKRFADKRNAETSVEPLPDGTNLTDASLRISWVLYRAFVRALHYRSLRRGRENFGVSQLQDITTLALLLHYVEVDHISQDSRVIPYYFEPIVNTFDALQERLQAIADWLFTEERPTADPPWTLEETIENKFWKAGEFRRVIDQILMGGPQNYDWSFWCLLFEKTEKCEAQHAVEHVEDILIEKRVVIEDEEWHVYETLIQHGVSYNIRDMQDLELPSQETITPRLQKIGQINRLRRNHQLLKDWNHKRPYYQLYYIFDTSDNGQYIHYRQNIAAWYAHRDTLASRPQPGVHDNSPSRIENIWAGMFPLHPVATHSAADMSKPQPELLNYDTGCIICMDEYVGCETIARLHCGHLFHLACIRSSWDNDRRYKNDCPLCRKDWQLSEIAGIEPEVRDVWDNERLLTVQEASTQRDIGELYRRLEDDTLEESEDWTRLSGVYDPRNALVELAHVRRKRKARNVARRRDIRLAGLGIQVPD